MCIFHLSISSIDELSSHLWESQLIIFIICDYCNYSVNSHVAIITMVATLSLFKDLLGLTKIPQASWSNHMLYFILS